MLNSSINSLLICMSFLLTLEGLTVIGFKCFQIYENSKNLLSFKFFMIIKFLFLKNNSGILSISLESPALNNKHSDILTTNRVF